MFIISNEGCIGSVSEIFDAEFPHHPKGCIAQAWGVAEILRVINDYNLIGEEKTIPETEAKEMVKDDAQKIVGSVQLIGSLNYKYFKGGCRVRPNTTLQPLSQQA